MAELPAGESTTEAATRGGSHLSIGEVLALLLEEFPDVTISKIRFLESQGLIEPERTASGYRKFYDLDVELLRCILREQKENFLPLKVIKDRLDTGEIDPTNETPRPRGITDIPDPAESRSLADSRRGHPSGGGAGPGLFERSPTGPSPEPNPQALTEPPSSDATDATRPSGVRRSTPDDTGGLPLRAGVVLDAGELASMAGLDPEQLSQLESYGLIVAGPERTYDENALEIARIAKKFLALGLDARHLRGWRVAADREAGLFEQIIQPLLRQRNPQSNDNALAQLVELDQYGAQLRSSLMRTLLSRHFEN